MNIDPNEAPAGYKAMPEIIDGGCYGCAFNDGNYAPLTSPCPVASCIRKDRIDQCDVIFVPEEEPNGCVHPKTPR